MSRARPTAALPKPIPPPGPRRAVIAHLALAALALVLVTGAVAVASWVFARGEAFRDAEQTGLAVTDVLLEPLAATDFAPARPVDRARLAEVFHPYLSSGVLYRVKVWRVEGDEAVVVFSDVAALDGVRRPYDHGLADRMAREPAVIAAVPPTPEHRYEEDQADRLLEVYRAFEDRSGAAMRLEIYLPADVAATTAVVLRHALPVSLAGLLALSAATLPLAIRLARRVGEIEAGQAELARSALAVSEAERTSLARWLHDGLVQHLATTGVIIDLVLGRADRLAAEDRRLLRQAHTLADADLAALRGKLGELAGPAVPATGLAAALESMASELTRPTDGVPEVVVAVSAEAELAAGTRALLVSVVAELLRNAVKHAGASLVTIRVEPGPGTVSATIDDDGHGFPVGIDGEVGADPGHAGLRLASAAVVAAGGRLRLLP
ncbi:MAG TPA: ATP-binding protein, partial [Candidatus Nanopelagicales bacterium]|nr:ATP-binding protein [Candidatus Nanopelagicales bacterium]